jgi:hypothetical protein
MKTWISDFCNRHETKILGVSTSPCVTRFLALAGLSKALTTINFNKNFDV